MISLVIEDMSLVLELLLEKNVKADEHRTGWLLELNARERNGIGV
jgi:hypothetical protein